MSGRLIKVPGSRDDRGALGFIEGAYLPFETRRVYFLYDVPSGKNRGAHGHVKLQQLIVCLKGSVDVVIDDGETTEKFELSTPEEGIFVPPMHWRELSRFSEDAVVLVLASTPYEPDDYIHDHSEFVERARVAKA